MKIFWNTALLLSLFVWIPVTCSYSSQGPEDQDTSGDDESSGSGLAEYDAPVMPTEQTTRIPATIASYSVSRSMLRETTAVSLMDPEETTNVFKKGFASTVVETYTKKISVKEDNRPTTDLKLNDKNTSVPYMKIMPVQTTEKADVTNLNIEDAAKTTTILTTTDGRNVIFENTILSEDRANVGNSDMDSDFHFVNEIKPRKVGPVNDPEIAAGVSSENTSLLERKEVLAGVVAGGVVGLMFALMLVTLLIYRMKKKDEGSYALEEHTHVGYQKPQRQMEFLA